MFASSHNWVSKGWHKAFRVSCFFASCPKAHTWNGDGRLQRSHLGEMLVSASTCVLALQDYNTAAAHHCSGLEWEGPGGTYLPRFGWTFQWPHPPVSATPPTQRHSSTSSRGADRGLCPHPYLPRGSALACQVRRGVKATAVCRTLRTNCSSWQLQSARPLPRL